MKEGFQTVLAEFGEAACLALCICEVGKPGLTEGEAVQMILEGIRRGYIKYDDADRNNPDNCFVEKRDEFMDLVTGEKGWKSTTEKPGYCPHIGERIIEYWQWSEPTKTGEIVHTHFKLPKWDPCVNSRTVKHGYLASLRVFRKAA